MITKPIYIQTLSPEKNKVKNLEVVEDGGGGGGGGGVAGVCL